jgi:O-antigen/teichoic acid export membrane protein
MGSSLIITWSVAIIVKVRVPRIMGPVLQGHFGFAESFAAMFFATLSLGIDTYIAKEVAVRPKLASEVVGGIFAIRVAMTALLLAAMAIVLVATGRPSEVLFAALIFGLANLLTANNGTLGAVLNTTPHVSPAALANIGAKVVWGIGLLVGLHFKAPLPLLALPMLVGESLRVVVMTWATRRGADLRLNINPAAVRVALVESVPYFVNSLALGVLGSLGMSVLEFVRIDEREVGWFAADQNLAYLCVLLMPLLGWVVMPLMSRAYARSEAEGLATLRRVVEGLVIVIVPITVLISAGSDLAVALAFGKAYAPAARGLSVLSLVFVMTYINTMLAMALVITGRGWSVTILSISAVFITAGLMLVLVPAGRHLLGEGGECTGAALSVITSEGVVLLAMLTRFREFPLDLRDLRAIGKSIGLGLVILLIDRALRPIGPGRLVVDAALYVVLAFAIGVVRMGEVRAAIALLRPALRRTSTPAPAPAATEP